MEKHIIILYLICINEFIINIISSRQIDNMEDKIHLLKNMLEGEVKKIRCVECEWANVINNTCELSNKKLYDKGEQLIKKCDLFKTGSWNCNEEREVKNE